MGDRFLDAGESFLNFISTIFQTMASTSKVEGYFTLQELGSDLIDKMSEALMPVAVGLLLIVFCLDLMEKTYQDNFNIQQLIGPFCRLIAGLVAVAACPQILGWLKEISNALLSSVSGAGTDSLKPSTMLNKLLNDPVLTKVASGISSVVNGGINVDDATGEVTGEVSMNIFAYIIIFVKVLPAYLASGLLTIYLLVIAKFRNIEFFIRGAFLPIACADLLSHGLSSSGMRYCKRMLALGAEGAVILAAYRICYQASQDVCSDIGWENSFTLYVVLASTLAFICVKSAKTISQDIFA